VFRRRTLDLQNRLQAENLSPASENPGEQTGLERTCCLLTILSGHSHGRVLPAAELYGDMLLEAGRYEQALAAYRCALQRAPLRLNSLYGAGKAAVGVGDDVMARAYFVELLSITSGAEEPRSGIKEIRAFMKTG